MSAQLDSLVRAEWGRLLSALIRSFGDFELAEDALQDAFAGAVREWAGGAPANPRAWLYTAARHNAIDQLRRRSRFAEKVAALAPPAPPAIDFAEEEAVPDERLRLIFTCCHPALAAEAQVALTLRTLCGLKTEEIARAFLVPATTMAQRLVRARRRSAARRFRIACRPSRSCPSGSPPSRRSSIWCSTRDTQRRPATRWCAASSARRPSGWRGCCARSFPRRWRRSTRSWR